MWTRFGSSTGDASSGTAHEFNKAYERYQRNPDSLRILFYFNQKQPNLNDINTKQLDSLREFKSKLGEKGVLYWNYDGVNEFEKLLKMHLIKKVQDFGEKWGTTTDTAEIVDATPEIEEMKKISGFDDDEEEYGFIEYIEIGTDNFETSTEAINRIASAIEIVGKKVEERGIEFHESQNPIPNMKAGKMILKRTADDMEQFVRRVEPEIPIFADGFSKGIDAITRSAVIINDFQGENDAQIREALTAVQKMKSSIIPALGSMQGLREVVYDMPRISRDVIKAKGRMAAILDKLIGEINSAKDLATEAEKTLEKALIDNQSLQMILPK